MTRHPPAGPGTKPRFVHDVAKLPNHAFGPDSLTWWGTVGFMAIEGMGFVLAVGAYFYLMREVPDWPPGSIGPPEPTWGTAFTAVLLASLLPNHWARKSAEKEDLRGALLGSVLVLAAGIVLLILRGFEFTALGVRWDTNAYGSIVWALLVLHTAHLATDVMDTAVLVAVLLRGHTEPRRLTDVDDNAEYWYFVVLSWLPLYVVLYGVPRWG